MKKSQNRVSILLSTFNGEKYIQQQLDSLLAQQGVAVEIHVRDDGSTDSTIEILSKYSDMHPNIHVAYEKNIGFVKSFFDLLYKSGPADYYAFCDQDDIWMPEKLYKAIEKLSTLQELTQPAMYFGRTEYVDEALNHLGYSPELNPQKLGFNHAIVQNAATGCTIVINAAARELCVASLPETCLFHDWWIYLLVSAFGVYIYDPASYIKYRQHEGNVIGAPKSFYNQLRRSISRSLNSDIKISSQLIEFERLFKNRLPKDKEKVLRKIIKLNERMHTRPILALSTGFCRQTFFGSILLRVTMLLGRF